MPTRTHTYTQNRPTRAQSTPRYRSTYPFATMYDLYESLSCTAYKLLGVIKRSTFTGETNTLDYPALAARVGCTVSTISRAMREIEAAGFIRRHRTQIGRGHTYTITVVTPEEWEQWDAATLAPLEAAPVQDGAFFSPPERCPKPITNDPCVQHSDVPVSSIPITQSRAACAPPDHQTHRSMQQQRFDGGDDVNTRTAEDLPKAPNGADNQRTQPLSIAPAAELMSSYTPDQHALFLRLRREYAEAVAAQMVAINPTLTVADFECDLRAAASRPNVFAPLGLVCDAWLRGSRVTPARSLVPPDDAPAPDAPVTDAPDAPAPRAAKRRTPSRAAPEPPTATQQLLLEAGFNPTTAREFRLFDVDAVQTVLTRALMGAMSATERNRVIGRLVVRWRNEGLAALSEGGQVTGDGEQDAGDGDGRHADEPGLGAAHEAGDTERCAAPVPPTPETQTPAPAPAAPAPPDALWAAVQERMRGIVGPVAFERDLAEVRCAALDPDGMTLACPSLAARDRLENTYLGQVRRVLCELRGVPNLWVRVILYRP